MTQDNKSIIAELDSLDFEANTATFSVPENARWTAGKYLITPITIEEQPQ